MTAVFGHPLQPFDHRALLIRPRITLCRHHHGNGMIIRPVDLRFIQPPFGTSQQQIQRLRAQTHHQHLCLRVAKPRVILHQPTLTVLDHQARIKHPLIGRAAPGHLGNRRQHDLIHCALGHRIGQHRGRRIRPHPAGIRASIAVAHPLVILCRADRQSMDAIGQHEETCLLAGHEFFNHHLRASRPELAAVHIVDRGQRLFDRRSHNHALARSQTIGLDDNRSALHPDIRLRRSRLSKARISRRRGPARIADFLGKPLRCLQLRGLGTWPECQKSRRPRRIRNPSRQRSFRPDNHEINRIFGAERDHFGTIENVKIRTFRQHRDPGIARRHDQAIRLRVLLHRPSQSMFAPA